MWLPRPNDPESEFVIYHFKVVLFGSVILPFMLSAALHKLLLTDGSPVAKDIQQNIYVNNIISGSPNIDVATQYYLKARQIMSDAHFNLRSWASNHHSIAALAQQDKVADSRTTVNMLWDTSTDTLMLNSKESVLSQHSLVTKQDVLKDVSKVFDLLGFFSPITMSLKVFLQELWQHKLDWDEPLPDDPKCCWNTIATSLQLIHTLPINRPYLGSDADRRQLHVFVDASKKGYGTVAYICQDGKSSLIMPKARVAPIRELALPKLELMVAVIGSRLLNFILTHYYQSTTTFLCTCGLTVKSFYIGLTVPRSYLSLCHIVLQKFSNLFL